MATLANAIQTLQSNIITGLNTDTTSVTFTRADGTTVGRTLSNFKIVDGMPSDLIKGTGFPYIIVHTPEISETSLTMTKNLCILTAQIEIYDSREGNVRLIVDRIRTRLDSYQDTLRDAGYTRFKLRRRSVMNYFPLPEGNKGVWACSLFTEYRFVG